MIAAGDILERIVMQNCKAYRLVRSYPIGTLYEFRVCGKMDMSGFRVYRMTYTWAGTHIRLAPNVITGVGRVQYDSNFEKACAEFNLQLKNLSHCSSAYASFLWDIELWI